MPYHLISEQDRHPGGPLHTQPAHARDSSRGQERHQFAQHLGPCALMKTEGVVHGGGGDTDVDGEARSNQSAVQTVEQADSVCETAQLNDIVSRQSQQIGAGVIAQCGSRAREPLRNQPLAHLPAGGATGRYDGGVG